jgi:hypothetical protein
MGLLRHAAMKASIRSRSAGRMLPRSTGTGDYDAADNGHGDCDQIAPITVRYWLPIVWLAAPYKDQVLCRSLEKSVPT